MARLLRYKINKEEKVEEKRKSNKFKFVAVTVILVSAIAFIYLQFGKPHISFAESWAQEQLNNFLPIKESRQAFRMNFNVLIDKINIDFVSNDKMVVSAVGTVSTELGSAEIEIETSGMPILDSDDIYYKPKNFEIKKFVFSRNVEEQAKNPERFSGSNLGKFAKEIMEKNDISVDVEYIKNKVKLAAKAATELTLTEYLKRHPVYKLKGAKQKFASSAIDEIKIGEDEVTIYFSL